MTAAGRALHLTQSAVSQQIARLEDLCGPLFKRERRGMRLTSKGEQLLGKARRLILLNDELWSDVQESTISGRVRLGAPYDLIGPWLGPILKAYAQSHPSVELSLSCASSPDLRSAVADGKIDIALVEEPTGMHEGECLAVDRLVWVGAKGGGAHWRTPLPLSLVAETCAFRPVVLGALDDHRRQWRTLFESGSIDATTETVRSDLAVTAWLASTVPADLSILGPDAALPELPPFAISLYQHKGIATDAVTKLSEAIRWGFGNR